MRYEDLTIEVTDASVERSDGARRGRFRVRVLFSPVGEMKPEEAVAVEYDDKDLQLRLARLEARELDAEGLQQLGRLLATLLLPPAAGDGGKSVRDYYALSLTKLGADTGLRLRLRLPARLAVLPWEYLYVDRTGGAGIDGYVALDRLCLTLGSVAGDMALAQGSYGVVIAGGVGLRLADHLTTSGFRDRFIAKGRFERRMDDMPVKLITYAEPGLFGAAAAFAREHS
jgi:hypothetical protein